MTFEEIEVRKKDLIKRYKELCKKGNDYNARLKRLKITTELGFLIEEKRRPESERNLHEAGGKNVGERDGGWIVIMPYMEFIELVQGRKM